MSSYPLEAVKQVIDLVSDEGIMVKSYFQHFKYLWDLDKAKLSNEISGGKVQTLIVVWDGMPAKEEEYPLNTEQYLTPLDWAVSISLKIDKIFKAKNKHPDFRIFIIDLESKNTPDSGGFKFFDQMNGYVKALPWVEVISIVPNAYLYFTTLLKDLSGSLRDDFGFATKKSPSMQSHIDQADLELIKRFWVSLIVKPENQGDHHSLSNILGPIIFDAGYINEPHIQALKNMLKSLELMPELEDV